MLPSVLVRGFVSFGAANVNFSQWKIQTFYWILLVTSHFLAFSKQICREKWAGAHFLEEANSWRGNQYLTKTALYSLPGEFLHMRKTPRAIPRPMQLMQLHGLHFAIATLKGFCTAPFLLHCETENNIIFSVVQHQLEISFSLSG